MNLTVFLTDGLNLFKEMFLDMIQYVNTSPIQD